MNTTYDYAMGMGPLAANSIPGAHRPSVADVKKLFPAKRARAASTGAAVARMPLRQRTRAESCKRAPVSVATLPSDGVAEGKRDPRSAPRILRA